MISQRSMVAASLAAVHHPDTYPRVARGYQPETCACGHVTGDHRNAGTNWPHPPRHGVCLIDGCKCRSFQPARLIPGTPRAA